MKWKYFYIIIVLSAWGCGSLSCRKFLNVKSDKSFSTPESLQDLQAILDGATALNRGPGASFTLGDDYYLAYEDWNGILNDRDKNAYVWEGNVQYDDEWAYMYHTIFYANTVLDNVDKIVLESEGDKDIKNRVKGGALFYRAWGFYQIAQLFAAPYDSSSAGSELGIPLRLTPDFSVASTRSNIRETYNQIVNDLVEAAQLLPRDISVKTRPCKAAALALLARTYLLMGRYHEAGKSADSCIQLFPNLINYNDIDTMLPLPFPRFNPEVIFPAYALPSSSVNLSIARIDSLLYRSYSDNDLRKVLFFEDNHDGTYGFKGNYEGFSYNWFDGIASDEVYLIRAECNARSGMPNEALEDLNLLLSKRWKAGYFLPCTTENTPNVLGKILEERRKELIYRGSRWSDIRRLNVRGAGIELRRSLDKTYLLQAGDPRFILLIPDEAITHSGMAQNPR